MGVCNSCQSAQGERVGEVDLACAIELTDEAGVISIACVYPPSNNTRFCGALSVDVHAGLPCKTSLPEGSCPWCFVV